MLRQPKHSTLGESLSSTHPLTPKKASSRNEATESFAVQCDLISHGFSTVYFFILRCHVQRIYDTRESKVTNFNKSIGFYMLRRSNYRLHKRGTKNK